MSSSSPFTDSGAQVVAAAVGKAIWYTVLYAQCPTNPYVGIGTEAEFIAAADTGMPVYISKLIQSVGSHLYVPINAPNQVLSDAVLGFTGTGVGGTYTVNGVSVAPSSTQYKYTPTGSEAPPPPAITTGGGDTRTWWYQVHIPETLTLTLKVYGALNLAGQTVETSLNGVSLGTSTVGSDGTYTVSIPVASVPSSDLTNDLSSGLSYTAKAQMLRPATAADLKSTTGAGLGKLRQGFRWALDVYQVSQLKIGTDFGSTLLPIAFGSDGGFSPELAIAAGTTFTGVQWGTLLDNTSFDAMLAWQCDTAVPCVVRAASIFIDGSET